MRRSLEGLEGWVPIHSCRTVVSQQDHELGFKVRAREEHEEHTYLSIWLVILNCEIGGWSSCCELSSSRVGALLAPVVGVDSTLESDQRDLHGVMSWMSLVFSQGDAGVSV